MISKKVDAILLSVQSLRPMPSNVTRILKEVEDPNAPIGIVAELIGLDQALAALVLQMANSVAMGYNRSCTSIRDAVMRIGLKRLKALLMASPAIGPMRNSLSGYRLGAGELWRHSLATAIASEWMAQALRYPNPEEAYASGLLHDVGKLVLDQYVLKDYMQILNFVQQYKMPLWQVEDKLIGIDHARVGGLIAERWGFPNALVDAISYHHYPSLARTNAVLPAIVNLANSVTAAIDQPDAILLGGEVHPETMNILHISEDRMASYREKLAGVLSIEVA
jgi:putative nucleotidyltransferase with HDIG domain